MNMNAYLEKKKRLRPTQTHLAQFNARVDRDSGLNQYG